MSETLAILDRFYAAELAYLSGETGFEPVAEFLDPEIVLHQAEGLPYGGQWRGPDGLARFLAVMARTWASFEILAQETLVDGDRVSVLSQVRARGRATGTELEFPILQLIRLRHGRLAEVRPFYWDTAAVAAVCAGADR
ncbi:nuclear transport factor 2 family protein [Crossiella sp. CA198]|uniref:nuclear transport factor 2 family protein n=1 Tax=Crossiella sp. CA198 TaxID=3455607 RepID=UPI003F8D573C